MSCASGGVGWVTDVVLGLSPMRWSGLGSGAAEASLVAAEAPQVSTSYREGRSMKGSSGSCGESVNRLAAEEV